ncbi:MAG: sulfotransferase, partial [Pseudomonadales bacterium]
ACKTMGNFDGAVQDYRAALSSQTANQPAHGEAYYSLANLKTYRFQDDEITAMRQQADNANLSYLDRVYLAFALGKACEDRGEFEESFRHYATGNQLKKAQSRYSAEQMTQALQAQMQVCSADFFAARQGYGHQAPDPIFILGLPRAGSTLLEQILASHSQVDGTLELPNILALANKLGRGEKITGESKYPNVLTEVSAADCERFGAEYLHDTRIHRQGAPFFIDKMPNNFRHIGLIKLILPNAKIIDARRHPMACCFSGFRQLFAEGQEFSYSLGDLGAYYRDYVELMTHWDKVLPGQVLTVNHEDVVDDLEGQVRRILDYCGVPFEQACLEFYKTERNVRTPSSEQVRQPIFSSGVDDWRNYEAWLGPLRDALGGLA